MVQAYTHPGMPLNNTDLTRLNASKPLLGWSAGYASFTSGPSWAVEASTDLTKWEEIGTLESIDEVDEFVDVNAGNFQSRYYRFRPITRAP